MSKDFIESLKRLVDDGNQGKKYYPLLKIKYKLEAVLETNAPALLFVGACDAVAGVRGHERIPEGPQRFLDDLGADSVLTVIENQVTEARAGGMYAPPDQVDVELPSYYSKLRFPQHEAYVWKSKYWLQDGNRKSPIHMVHGRIISYIPPCARNCFKIWKTTGKSFRFATKVASGSKKALCKAWEPLLSAYSVMECGDYDPAKFEETKKNFMETLVLPNKSEKARIGASAKRDQKQCRDEQMKAVRAAKRGI
ncbi:hypothetical protein F444_00684 [Phytophthora nicotianae P1976]|uniref:Uncharacterized protein n=1 Tax=Phytophthora nicotianae P1976 TaxID=1317066 RepID=A0A081B3G8_PHYNI|nr:hypothetical protein F444_00684 [Phytophthora nicotianae P1976]